MVKKKTKKKGKKVSKKVKKKVVAGIPSLPLAPKLPTRPKPAKKIEAIQKRKNDFNEIKKEIVKPAKKIEKISRDKKTSLDMPQGKNDDEKNPKIIVKKMSPRKLKIERDIAMDFAAKVQKKFDRLVKASVLFGSQVKSGGVADVGSDIDIILIVDDVATNWDLELVSWYREELAKVIASQKYGKELHVNTVRLSTWWDDMMHGDPVVVNILRYGETLIDYGGFFNPLKALLLKGKVRSTPEAVHAALRRAPMHITRSRVAEMSAIEGVYWAMVDSAQAALMTAGKMPPSPDHIPEMLKLVFVDAGMLKMNYVKAMSELYNLHKAITHGHVNDIKGQEIDEWQEMAEKFMLEMTRIIDALLEKK